MDYCAECGRAASWRCPRCGYVTCSWHEIATAEDEHGHTLDMGQCPNCWRTEMNAWAASRNQMSRAECSLQLGELPRFVSEIEMFPEFGVLAIARYQMSNHVVRLAGRFGKFAGRTISISGWKVTLGDHTALLCDDKRWRDPYDPLTRLKDWQAKSAGLGQPPRSLTSYHPSDGASSDWVAIDAGPLK